MRVGYGEGCVTRCPCGSRNWVSAYSKEGREFIRSHALPEPESIPIRIGDYVAFFGLIIVVAIQIFLILKFVMA